MTTITALESKNSFGQFLDAVQRAPVTVTKNGRAVGALLKQSVLNRRLEEADVAPGRVHVAADAFFERLREHVRRVAAEK